MSHRKLRGREKKMAIEKLVGPTKNLFDFMHLL